MKNLKKINIGLVLTIITILAVVIYLIGVENQRKNAKEEIRKSCDQYITILDQYLVLPEEVQVFGEASRDVNLDSFYSELEDELKESMISDSATSIQKKIITDYIERDLLNTSIYTTNYDRKITKIRSYEFDGNQVTVLFDSKVTIKQKYIDVNPENGEQQEKTKEKSFDATNDTITLEKKDGKWKIVYSNIEYQFDNYNNQM